MIYVEFMKNFYLADCNQLRAVRLNPAYWAQKRFIIKIKHIPKKYIL